MIADVAGSNGLLLECVLTPEAGFVIVVDGVARPGKDRPACCQPERCLVCFAATLVRSISFEHPRLWPRPFRALHEPVPSSSSLRSLAALWRVLIPEEERQGLVSGRFKTLTIVPDGPLGLLTFEALITDPGSPLLARRQRGSDIRAVGHDPLESGSPRTHRCAERTTPVLSVGDPLAVVQLATASRLATVVRSRTLSCWSRQIAPLAFAAAESESVVTACRSRGIGADRLPE